MLFTKFNHYFVSVKNSDLSFSCFSSAVDWDFSAGPASVQFFSATSFPRLTALSHWNAVLSLMMGTRSFGRKRFLIPSAASGFSPSDKTRLLQGYRLCPRDYRVTLLIHFPLQTRQRPKTVFKRVSIRIKI